MFIPLPLEGGGLRVGVYLNFSVIPERLHRESIPFLCHFEQREKSIFCFVFPDITEFAAGAHPLAYDPNTPLCSIQPVRPELVEGLNG